MPRLRPLPISGPTNCLYVASCPYQRYSGFVYCISHAQDYASQYGNLDPIREGYTGERPKPPQTIYEYRWRVAQRHTRQQLNVSTINFDGDELRMALIHAFEPKSGTKTIRGLHRAIFQKSNGKISGPHGEAAIVINAYGEIPATFEDGTTVPKWATEALKAAVTDGIGGPWKKRRKPSKPKGPVSKPKKLPHKER